MKTFVVGLTWSALPVSIRWSTDGLYATARISLSCAGIFNVGSDAALESQLECHESNSKLFHGYQEEEGDSHHELLVITNTRENVFLFRVPVNILQSLLG